MHVYLYTSASSFLSRTVFSFFQGMPLALILFLYSCLWRGFAFFSPPPLMPWIRLSSFSVPVPVASVLCSKEALDKLIEHTRATTVIVAHRLSTIRNADQIIVLDSTTSDSSKVVQIGNHDSLMRDKVRTPPNVHAPSRPYPASTCRSVRTHGTRRACAVSGSRSRSNSYTQTGHDLPPCVNPSVHAWRWCLVGVVLSYTSL